jgi:hypothetical protein
MSLNMKAVLYSIAASMLMPLAALSADDTCPEKPNIMLILADDCGIPGAGCYGGECVQIQGGRK